MLSLLWFIGEGETSYYVRSRYMLNGSKMITVRYYVPVSFINDEAGMQAQVLQSLDLTNKIDRKPEPVETYRFLDVAEVSYPQGWEARAERLRRVDRMNVTLLNVRQIEMASRSANQRLFSKATETKIDVDIIAASAKKSLLDEVDNYKKQIERSGMLIGDKLREDYEFSYSENIDFAVTEVYEGVNSSNNLSEFEFWFTVMVGGNYYYFIMMLTTSRNERFELWAENTQHYKALN